MDARRFLDVARELVAGVNRSAPLTGGAGEPECRTAIGRAYYGAFLVARRFLHEIGIRVAGTSASHTTVQFALNNADVDLLIRVSSQLRELHYDRTRADYEPADTDPERASVAEVAIGRADFVMTAFELIRAGRVSPPVDLTAVANAIAAWAKANGQEGKVRKM
jgi:hypothetical protein